MGFTFVWSSSCSVHYYSSLFQEISVSSKCKRSFICCRSEKQNGMDMVQESIDLPNKLNHTEIWKLFRQAQGNILHLNRQRLMAIRDLEKIEQEKYLLLQRIQRLELENQALLTTEPRDMSSVFIQLLLRIDAMIVSGNLSVEEASQLRRLIMDNMVAMTEIPYDIHKKGDFDMLKELRRTLDKRKRKTFHIVHVCTEMAPVASVGTLALYVTGLSRALQEKGNLVEIILPKYSNLDLDKVQGLRKTEAVFPSYFNESSHGNRIWHGVVSGIGVTFIEPLHDSTLFNREMIYGYSDDFERFSYFSRASLDYIVKSAKRPDIIHVHNWETAIIAPLFWDVFVHQGLEATRILLTCHDFRSQCLEQPDKLALCGLNPSQLHRPDRLQDDIKKNLVNILKGGVVYSNRVMVMSLVHSKSKIVGSMSHGLESTLTTHKEKVSVAPYGYDSTLWDPSSDELLPANYNADDIKGKSICKVALGKRFGLSLQGSTIIVGCIYHQYADLDLESLSIAISLAYRKGAKIIIMGNSEVPSAKATMESLKDTFKDRNIRYIKHYDEAVSHLLLAGSDIILCPTFDDPILQMPLKAIKYGAAPILVNPNKEAFRHEMEHDPESSRSSQYIISAFGDVSLNHALDQMNTSQWSRKIREGMQMDFSWEAECCDMHMSAYTHIQSL